MNKLHVRRAKAAAPHFIPRDPSNDYIIAFTSDEVRMIQRPHDGTLVVINTIQL